jgi:pyridoxal phosphate enzyme (YggS family)
MSIADNLRKVREQIAAACAVVGRDPSTVTLCAVSKMHPLEMVMEAYAAGQLDFGENYVQEAREKVEQSSDGPRWHFIGHLQRNKVKYIAPWVQMIHTVDTVALADEINKRAAQHARTIDVLVQVNIAQEDVKSGCDPAQAKELIMAMAALPNLRLRGLMTMPPFWEAEELRPFFRQLRELRDCLQTETGLPLPELSMGMSSDFNVAIEEGATIVRIGTAIFGDRI